MLAEISIYPSRQHLQAAAPLAAAFEREWPRWYGPGGEGNAAADLAAYANSEGALPVGVVALSADGDPIGTAALKAAFTPGFAHLTPLGLGRLGASGSAQIRPWRLAAARA
jgi:hypothetical protein